MTTQVEAVQFDYSGAALPIPDRIRDCHLRDWERLRGPGAWWSGAERVAIARQSRLAEDCGLCRERAAALSPASVVGECPTDPLLPSAAVEAIHKLITDKSRLSRDWYERVVSAEGMSEERYIELLGVLVHVFAVDELHRALDLPLEPLPEPLAGAPSGYRPAGAAKDASWPPILLPENAAPGDLDIYAEMGGRRPANVISALSLVPDNVRWLNDQFAAHYLSWTEMGEIDKQHRTLTRPQLELLATRVSALNECFY